MNLLTSDKEIRILAETPRERIVVQKLRSGTKIRSFRIDNTQIVIPITLDAVTPETAEVPVAQTMGAAVAQARLRAVSAALEAADYHREEAARILGISRKNLWEHMREFGLCDKVPTSKRARSGPPASSSSSE